VPKHFQSNKDSQLQPEPPPESDKAVTTSKELFSQSGENIFSPLLDSDRTNASSDNDKELFVVPNWFSTQPQPYTRPTELFRSSYGMGAYGAGRLFPPLGGFWGGGPAWGWSRLGTPYWGGYTPFSGGWFGAGIYSSPFWGATSGLWGRAWSGLGFGSNLGSLRSTGAFSTAVIQSEPSKASGNYYAPSTIDTTASGSYYASGAPALTPAMRVNKSPDNYWDENSNPIPRNLR
jgi:hypothetical protein